MAVKTSIQLLRLMILLSSLSQVICYGAEADSSLFSSFADGHSVALWLFDETYYPHTTLTDAGINEYDLRLQKAGSLVPGKFGNALRILPGPGYAVSYAGFKGSIAGGEMREDNGTPSGLWAPAVAPKKILSTFADDDWTLEFWLRLHSVPAQDVVLIDLGHAYDPGVTIQLSSGAESFKIKNNYAAFAATCLTDSTVLADGKWHHVTFTRDASASLLRHNLDGKLQPPAVLCPIAKQATPPSVEPDDREHGSFGFSAKRTHQWRRLHRFNLAIGQDRTASNRLAGMIDELRLSDIKRYSDNFSVPASFSRNYGPNAPKPAVPTGPPLLFAQDSSRGPIQLGSRKHLFIDDALIHAKKHVELTCNPPTNPQSLNFGPKKSAWRASVLDEDGKVYMFIPDGYGSEKGITRLRISEDGVNFTKPNLGVVRFEGSTDNDYVFAGVPLYGTFFKDLNPNITTEEKFKLTAWVANRGIYLYVSPDGIHWRRNETCMLPLVSGGGAETYWDDQRGVYVDFIKRDSSFRTDEYPGRGRRACMFETTEIFKTWPFKALKNPYFESWPFPAVTGEGPVIFGPNKNGQIYRTRAIKYPWAPDTYLAFVWRFDDEDEHRQVDLGVSRDGIHWKFYADKTWYMTPGDAEEVLSLYGLIRRGDRIWQYADYGGAHGGGKRRNYARLTQRLDGFVSLDAGNKTGSVITRPLVFKGDKLILNISAKGWAKVTVMDEGMTPIPGFTLDQCDLITGDSVGQTVAWGQKADVSGLAGKVVRLKFEMQRAKLYALKFD